MRTLWVHIGSHKTGTTSLQVGLRGATCEGALGPFTYRHHSLNGNYNALVKTAGSGAEMRWGLDPLILSRSNFLVNSGDRFEVTRWILTAIVKILRTFKPRDSIISAERLFWLDDQSEIEKLAEQAKQYFDNVKIVAYLRRQDQLAVSFRKTIVSHSFGRRFFGDRIGIFPDYEPHMDRYFCYAEKLQLWENVFGAENIIVRRYEKSSLIGGDTLADFCGIIGVDANLEGEAFSSQENRRWNRTQLAVGMWLQKKGYSSADILSVIEGIEDDQQMIPARAEAVAFMHRFAASNALLAKKYDSSGPSTYFDEDFSMFPEQGNDNLENLTVDLTEIEKRLQAQGDERA